MNPTRTCAVQNCGLKHHAHGYCAKHAARLRANGHPEAIRRTTTVDSFFNRVHKAPSGCWEWTGYVGKNGYGKLATRLPLVPGGSLLAHRASYEFHVGPIPEGMHLDHLCRVTHCVNPEHLEPVTPQENAARGLHGVLRTHCLYGHELTPENTVYDARRNCRRCRTCSAATARRTALRNRVGNESYNASRRKPCQRCGRPKGPGPRKKLCDNCREVAA